MYPRRPIQTYEIPIAVVESVLPESFSGIIPYILFDFLNQRNFLDPRSDSNFDILKNRSSEHQKPLFCSIYLHNVPNF